MERVGWTIPEWGQRYGWGRTKAYKIISSGQGPKVRQVADSIPFITAEDDAEWRRQLPVAPTPSAQQAEAEA
jgi:hypothetical protein